VRRVFAGHDGGSGCAWYRMQVPLLELGRHGWDVTYEDAGDKFHPPSVTLRDLEGHDVVVAQRWNKHDGLSVWRRASLFAKTVYELDDDLWNITPDNWNAYKMYGDPQIRDAVEHAAGTADLVTVSTEPLAGVLRQFSDNVVVLPNHLPGWVLDLPVRPQRDRPRVGWMGGASHGVDIGQVAQPVRRFLKRFPGWDFVTGGTDYRPTIKAAPDRMYYKPWIQVNEEPDRYYTGIDFDIGLCPLWPTTFSNSKSALKAIEYGARGIPSICSDSPAYRPVITHGVNGFLVKQEHEWLKYLSELARDDDLRRDMGKAAQAMAARYVIEDGWRLWETAYESLF
jgi:glycosyltransferase involved in cell wall biosynthesis